MNIRFSGVAKCLRRITCGVAFWSILILGLVHSGAHAQSYPNRPIRLIVPYPAGGSADSLVRPLLPRLQQLLGQSVTVDNRSGANGILGMEVAARSPADGYTMVLGAIGPLSVSPSIQKLPFDPQKDFAPVTFLANVPNVLVVNPAMPVFSVADLVSLAKKKPGELNYGSAGVASSNQLAAELFKRASDVQITHVPYRGGAPAVTDLLAGQLSLIFDNAPSAIAQVKAKSLKAIAVTSLTRQPAIPDVPTMVEAGYPNFEAGSWFGILLPAHTPEAIVDRLNRAFVEALQDPKVHDRLVEQGFDLNPGSPLKFAEFIRSETSKWSAVVKAAGIKEE